MKYVIVLALASLMPATVATAQYSVANAFDNLNFNEPIGLVTAADGSGRFFVLEREGIIRSFLIDPQADETLQFLDVTARVDSRRQEEGLLGLAFHPAFPDSSYFYVNYTASNPSRTVISRFDLDPLDTSVADPGSELILMEFDQPYDNHNGGQLAFGPDGMLYIAVGDGGSGGDPEDNAQDRTTLLGSILRIDVDHRDMNKNYAIPPDNPFAGNNSGFLEEIYAFGLRNPWRFSFDPTTSRLWAGDVGQNAFEEIDLIESGKNYGWNIMEASSCYESGSCDQTGLVLPVHEYSQGNNDRSVIGGYVYRGSAMPSLYGKYIYGDYVSGRIWALTDTGSGFENELVIDSSIRISTFGVDHTGELYVCDFGGTIYRMESSEGVYREEPDEQSLRFALEQNYPNPVAQSTSISFDVPVATHVRITVYDLLGREVKTLIDGIVGTGQHSATFNAENIPNGTYTFRMETGDGWSQSRVLTILR